MLAEGHEPCRILVADDDRALRTLTVTALKKHRLGTIETAEDGAQAIERLVTGPPWTVLILDLMMPRKSGWDVIDWLAQDSARMPHSVIVVSAADRNILQQLDPAVVNAIIFKPFDVFQLAAYVKAACQLARDDRRSRRIVGAI